MRTTRLGTKGAVVYEPDVYHDDRGYFMETLGKFHGFTPVQFNQSKSKKGVVRGMHYQKDTAKLVWVAQGSIYDLAIDPKTGEQVSVILEANGKQLYVPKNFLHGFQALEDDTIVCYAMDNYYDQATEGGYSPDIDWPLKERIISDKDKNADKLPS